MLLLSKPEIGSPMSYGKSLAGSLEKKDHIVELIYFYLHIQQTALNVASTYIGIDSNASELQKYKSLCFLRIAHAETCYKDYQFVI